MNKARKENNRQGRAVIFQQHANPVFEQRARADSTGQVRKDEDQQGNDDGKVEGSAVAETVEDLDALLEVDEGDVEAEDVTGESGDPAEPVAGVCDGENPMEDEGPAKTALVGGGSGERGKGAD